MTDPEASKPTWTFLTNHAHVLVCLMADPGLRGWEIAQRVGITERATQKIIADLVAEGYLERERVGRRNHYRVHTDRRLRHPLESHQNVGDVLEAVTRRTTATPTAAESHHDGERHPES